MKSKLITYQLFDGSKQKYVTIEDYNYLRGILKRIISDLPNNRDWLDPQLEQMAKDVIQESEIK